MARGHSTRLLSVVFVALSLLAVSQSENVLELTQSNIDSAVDGPKHLMVDFYAPWCQHCRDTMPLFEKAAIQLKDQLPQVTFAKMDCTTNKAVCDKYGVKFIPSIQHFYQGKALEEMSVEKSLENIVAFAKTSYQDAVSAAQKLQDRATKAE